LTKFKVKRCHVVSVIVSTHNRPEMLRSSLLSLLRQTLDSSDYEIIVGDSYSDNEGVANKQVVEDIRQEFPSANIRYFYEATHGGVTLTRTRAIKTAFSEYILIGDDDFAASSSYIEEGLKALTNEKVGIVEGRMVPSYIEEAPVWEERLWTVNEFGRYLLDFTLLDFGDDIKHMPYQFAFASNMGFRKDVFFKCGGFAPDGFGGKLILYNGLGENFFAKNVADAGYDILYVPGMFAQHKIMPYRFKNEYFQARHYYYGIGGSFDAIRQRGNVDGALSLAAKQARSRLSCCKQMFTGGKFTAMCRKAYRQGYTDHQQAVSNHPEMLDYICRENWLDFDFSTLRPMPKTGKSLW